MPLREEQANFIQRIIMRVLKIRPLLLILTFIFSAGTLANAESNAQKLDRKANNAINRFYKEVKGSQEFLNKAKGYLVFPEIMKAGFVVGGSYGKGVMRINGQTKHYYDVTSASFGWQIGAQKHSMVIAFLTDASLDNFIKSNGWEAGIDGTITLIDEGISKDITSLSYEKPIIAFIYGEKGLMGGISMEGNKFRRILP